MKNRIGFLSADASVTKDSLTTGSVTSSGFGSGSPEFESSDSSPSSLSASLFQLYKNRQRF